jgi:hypothetical protein
MMDPGAAAGLEIHPEIAKIVAVASSVAQRFGVDPAKYPLEIETAEKGSGRHCHGAPGRARAAPCGAVLDVALVEPKRGRAQRAAAKLLEAGLLKEIGALPTSLTQALEGQERTGVRFERERVYGRQPGGKSRADDP